MVQKGETFREKDDSSQTNSSLELRLLIWGLGFFGFGFLDFGLGTSLGANSHGFKHLQLQFRHLIQKTMIY